MNASTNPGKKPPILHRGIMTLTVTLAMGCVAAAPAMADDWHHDGPGFQQQQHPEGHDRSWHRRMEREHRYNPPPVVVAPAAREVYAPPPVVVSPPAGLNIVIPLTVR